MEFYNIIKKFEFAKDAYDISNIKKIDSDTRKFLYEFNIDEGTYFLKSIEKSDELEVLSIIKESDISDIVEIKDTYFIEKKYNPNNNIDKLINSNIDIGSILAKGYNKLHQNKIVYKDCIDEHWFYDQNKDEIKITDFGEAKVSKDREDDIYEVLSYLKLNLNKDKVIKNWNSFKKNYKFKQDLKKFENEYKDKEILIINNL